MDRRQQKSRRAILTAVGQLLTRKRYEHITVQEIIDTANVCRSTFYAHFETKDMLLKALCADMFDHIFEGAVCEYTAQSVSFQEKLTHILWHMQHSPTDIRAILNGESGALFLEYLKGYLYRFFARFAGESAQDAPSDFRLNVMVGSFTQAVVWWVKEGMHTPPADIARWFIQIVG